MASIASENRTGSSGWNTFLFFFSQPKGQVMTTSSNSREELSPQYTDTLPERDSTDVTLVDSFIFAFFRAGRAIVSSIF